MVDMHAAHERLNYNRIFRQITSGETAIQSLLLPIRVPFAHDRLDRLKERLSLFNRFGMELQLDYGSREVVVRSLPNLPGNLGTVTEEQVEELLTDVVEQDYSDSSFKDIVRLVAARLACHASVRSGDRLNPEEVDQIFKELDSDRFANACPQGRPLAISIERRKIERWFAR